MKFSLRTLLLTVLISAVVIACISLVLPRQTPVTSISTTRQWQIATKGNCQVLFVDNSFHKETKVYAVRFDSFCRRFRQRSGRNPIFICDPMENKELWAIIEMLWRDEGLANFHNGLKGWGGRGVIAWVKNGELVDYALLHRIETNEEFNRRCDSAFKTSSKNKVKQE